MAKLLSPSSSMTDEKIKWSKTGLAELKAEVIKMAASSRSREQPPPRILFMGETGSGKSSLISGIVSALKGRIVYTFPVGEKAGEEVNTSRKFLEHRVFLEAEGGEQVLNFILCDSRGIGKKQQHGAAEEEIRRLIDGQFQHGDLIEDERGNSGVGREVDLRPPNPPSSVVIVQKAPLLGEKDPDVCKKLDLVCSLIKQKGISSCVVLTHIDQMKQSLQDKLHLALSSQKLENRVEMASKELGVTKNRVFLVKNYVHEHRNHTRHDILLLRALRGILLDVQQKMDDSSTRRSNSLGGFEARDLPIWPVPSDGRAYNSTQSGSSGYRSASERPPSFSSNVSEQFSSISQQPPSESGPVMPMAPPERARQSLRRLQCNRAMPLQPQPSFQGQRNAPPRTSKLSNRSGEHDYRINCSGSTRSDDTTQSASSDEKDFNFNDDDIEEEEVELSAFGSSGCGYSDQTPELLNKRLNELVLLAYPSQYRVPAKLSGARPLREKRVVQQSQSSLSSDDQGSGLQQQLQKEYFREEHHRDLHQSLHDWFKTDRGSVWTSDTLHTDLGLPVQNFAPDSIDVQILFLAPGCPPCLITLFDTERTSQNPQIPRSSQTHQHQDPQTLKELESQQVEFFTTHMGKLLTAAMLNFCSCDFLILPLCLEVEKRSREEVLEALKRQRDLSRRYFGGPQDLSEASYLQLNEAVTAVVSVSRIPQLLPGGGGGGGRPEERELWVLMDRNWRGVVSLLIEKLTRAESVNQWQQATYPRDAWFKMTVAVVEAARRLSYGEQVLIVTDVEDVRKCSERLKQQVRDNTGLELNLTVVKPHPGFQKGLESSWASFVIVLNLPELRLNMANAAVLCVTEEEYSSHPSSPSDALSSPTKTLLLERQSERVYYA